MASNPQIESYVVDLVALLNSDLYLGAEDVPDTVCFDCELWNNGYSNESGVIIIQPIKTTLVNLLGEIITTLNALEVEDYAFKTQIARFVDMLTDLQNKINSVQCSGACGDIAIISQLLAVTVKSVLDVIEVLEILNGLLAYNGTCGCMGSKLFEILMGKFINSITAMQCVIQDWYGLVMTFFQLSSTSAKSYVAAYVPNQPITPPPMPGPMSFACVPCPPRPQQNCQPCTQQHNNCIPYHC